MTLHLTQLNSNVSSGLALGRSCLLPATPAQHCIFEMGATYKNKLKY